MRVRVEVCFSFKREIGDATVVLELEAGATVLDAVRALTTRFPEIEGRLFDGDGVLHRHINALLNGGNVSFRKGFATPLADGDLLALLPPVGGG